MEEIILNGKTYVLKEEQTEKDRSNIDESGNINCNTCSGCVNCSRCDNCSWCNHCLGCDNCSRCNTCSWCVNCSWCDNCSRCNTCSWCDHCSWCFNCTRCNSCAYLIYCHNLTLEKFMVFNQPVKNKEEFMKIRDKILSRLGVYKHPKDLTASDKNWLKDNISQYDESVLNNIINDSILPDKPKRTD